MVTGGVRRTALVLLSLTALLITACSAKSEERTGAPPGTGSGGTGSGVSSTETSGAPADANQGFAIATTPEQADVQHLSYKIGPIKINPGQNNIDYSFRNGYPEVPKPEVDGFITGIKANLVRPDGSVPPVDVIHLHHGVWANMSGKANPKIAELFFAAGEEKTSMILPAGYGYPFKAKDRWVINYMLHNLLATPDEVSITYDIDFIAADAPNAKNIKPARPIWMDVESGKIYPVFDVLKGSGADGTFTYPDQAQDPYGGKPALNEWTVDRDGVLLATAGHLHPGGLHTDMYLTRAGAGAAATPAAKEAVVGDKAHLFRSEAVYYEPAGAVSWDVSMSATTADWRVAVKKGDKLSINATYDTERASWYESMGIMIVWMGDAEPGAPDPYQTNVATKGVLTHGHLPENDNHGGEASTKFIDLTQAPSGPNAAQVDITDFVYTPGDMAAGLYQNVPTIKPGQPLRFVNNEATAQPTGVWHTITACKAPCTGATGVAYPLADADIGFDSGQLGKAGVPTAGRLDWNAPTDLPDGTYTYFCRVHPSMRGAFRVEQ